MWEKLTKTDGRGLSYLQGMAPMALLDERMKERIGDPLLVNWTRENALAEVENLIAEISAKIDNTANESDSD